MSILYIPAILIFVISVLPHKNHNQQNDQQYQCNNHHHHSTYTSKHSSRNTTILRCRGCINSMWNINCERNTTILRYRGCINSMWNINCECNSVLQSSNPLYVIVGKTRCVYYTVNGVRLACYWYARPANWIDIGTGTWETLADKGKPLQQNILYWQKDYLW